VRTSQGKETNNALNVANENVRFGVFLHECIESTLTSTGSVILVSRKHRIEAKEWEMRDGCMASQKQRKSKQLKNGHDYLFSCSLLSNLSRC